MRTKTLNTYMAVSIMFLKCGLIVILCKFGFELFGKRKYSEY